MMIHVRLEMIRIEWVQSLNFEVNELRRVSREKKIIWQVLARVKNEEEQEKNLGEDTNYLELYVLYREKMWRFKHVSFALDPFLEEM